MDIQTYRTGKRPTAVMIDVILQAAGSHATPENVRALKARFIEQNQEIAAKYREFASRACERILPGFDLAEVDAYRHISAA